MSATRLLQLIEWHLQQSKEFVALQVKEKNYHRRKEHGERANRHSLIANACMDHLNHWCAEDAQQLRAA